MDVGVKTAGAAPLGRWLSWRRANVLPPGTPCRNCGAALQGPYCHDCGQLGEDFDRKITRLVVEALESFFQIDGKFLKTMPRLFLRPGELTRDYVEGRRAFQIPPLRLFLTVLVIFFLAGELNGNSGLLKVNDMPPAREAKFQADLRARSGRLGTHGHAPVVDWFKTHAERAARNPARFKAAMSEWTHRFAVLMLPIGALILSLLFVFQRRFYVFDHLIFTMHSLSFQGLLLSPVILFGGLAKWLLCLAPAHLFFHMRGAYGASVIGTLVRMALLFVASGLAFVALLLALVFIGLSAVGS